MVLELAELAAAEAAAVELGADVVAAGVLARARDGCAVALALGEAVAAAAPFWPLEEPLDAFPPLPAPVAPVAAFTAVASAPPN
jgi:hypothetical protein